jgi:hypothetical protein
MDGEPPLNVDVLPDIVIETLLPGLLGSGYVFESDPGGHVTVLQSKTLAGALYEKVTKASAMV